MIHETPQQARVLVAKPDYLSLIVRTHVVERENRSLFSSVLHMYAVAHTQLHKHTNEGMNGLLSKNILLS